MRGLKDFFLFATKAPRRKEFLKKWPEIQRLNSSDLLEVCKLVVVLLLKKLDLINAIKSPRIFIKLKLNVLTKLSTSTESELLFSAF